jgi:NAD(P)-dependent dehydrogenase (short-subunit alcohol dehydrogenase family)
MAVLAEHGRIDNLVNNAGGQYMTPLKAMSTKGFEAVLMRGGADEALGASAMFSSVAAAVEAKLAKQEQTR